MKYIHRAPRALGTLLLGVLLGAAPSYAQGGTRAPAAPKKEEPKAIAIEKGEIRLDGRISAMTGATGFDIKAFSFSTPAGKTIEFDEAKDKSVAGGKETKVLAGDDLARPLPWNVVKLGMRVAVIGKDGGSGKPIVARAIVLADFSSKYIRGRSIPTSRAVSVLVGRGRQAFEGGNYEAAAKLFQQAASTGTGTGDLTGASLSLSWLGNALGELGQREKAVEVLLQSVATMKGAGREDLAGTAMNNLGNAYMQVGQPAAAVKWLEQSVALMDDGESEESRLVTQLSLARAYAMNKQLDRALDVWRGLLPTLKQRGDSDQEGTILLGIAGILRQQNKADESAAALAQARERIAATTDAPKKADALLYLASYLKSTGDKEGARATLNSAIEIYNAAGDARSAGRARVELVKLDAPEAAAPATAAPVTEAPAAEAAPAEAAPAEAAPTVE
jgi:tetratricopeptide (TPR) repeat protein